MKAVITIGETNNALEKEAFSIKTLVDWIEENLPYAESECPDGQSVGVEFFGDNGEPLEIDY